MEGSIEKGGDPRNQTETGSSHSREESQAKGSHGQQRCRNEDGDRCGPK